MYSPTTIMGIKIKTKRANNFFFDELEEFEVVEVVEVIEED